MAGGYPPPGPNQQQPNYQQQPQGQYQQPPQGYAQPSAPAMVDPNAPYGIDPKTGIPFSDKQKSLAGLMQLACIVIAIPGIGRFYTGHIGIGVAQLLLGCTGIGQIWSIIDGIMMFTGQPKDAQGRPLREN